VSTSQIVAQASNPSAFQQDLNTCNSGLYYVSPWCWYGPWLSQEGSQGFISRDAWTQLAALPVPPNSILASPGAPSSSTPDPTDIDTLVDQAATDTQSNIADFASTISDNPIPDVPCTWLNIPCWMLLLAGGLGLFVILAPDAMASHSGGRSIL